MRYNDDNGYLSVNGKEIFKFRAENKNFNFLTQFFIGSISNGFGAAKFIEVSLKGNVFDFSIDYSATDNSDMLDIHKYLMVKNNIKQCLVLFNKCLLDFLVLVDL